MKLGIHSVFHTGSVDLAEFAVRCEALGFESFWLPEHTVIPVTPSVGSGGVVGGQISDHYVLIVDPLIGLTVAAAATSRILLGTGVCLIPEHHPIDLAKHISTLDFYSGGRFILGAGAGWQPEESAAMGADFPHRWTQTKECIDVMRKMWTEEEPEHSGRYYSFPPMKFHPKPVQQPVPVLLGGSAQRVFRRVASWADGWAPWLASPEEVAEGRRKLDRECERAGRDPATASITVFVDGLDHEGVDDYSQAGADRVVFTVPSTADGDAFGVVEGIARAEGLGS